MKALIVVTSHLALGTTGKLTGWYLPEVTHAYYPLLEAGFEVDFASPQGGKAPMDEGSRDLSDPLNRRFLEDPVTRGRIEKTLALSEVNPSKYQTIFFAGGHGTMWDFPESPDVARVTAAIYEAGGVVAAVCHGPAALVNVRLSNGRYLVDGRELTAFSNNEERAVELETVMPFPLESKLVERGARYSEAPLFEKHVVVSDRLVTGQNPASAAEVGEAIVRLLKSRSTKGAGARGALVGLTTLALSGSAVAGTIALPPESVHPEGIAYRAKTGAFYVGSAANGSIAVTTAEGPARLLQPSGTDGRTKALGIQVDEKRGRLWLVDGAAIYVYGLDDNRLIRKLPLAGVAKVSESALNDLAIDSRGSAYVTDSFNPHILKVDGGSLKMSVFRDVSAIPYGSQNGMPYNLNGIVISPDGRHLISVKTNDGSLWRVGLRDRRVSRISLSEPVTKGDGLAWGASGDLYVIRNFENKISKVDLRSGRVSAVAAEGLDIPTTAAFVAGPAPELVVVNSQFGKEKPSSPFTLTRVSLPSRSQE